MIKKCEHLLDSCLLDPQTNLFELFSDEKEQSLMTQFFDIDDYIRCQLGPPSKAVVCIEEKQNLIPPLSFSSLERNAIFESKSKTNRLATLNETSSAKTREHRHVLWQLIRRDENDRIDRKCHLHSRQSFRLSLVWRSIDRDSSHQRTLSSNNRENYVNSVLWQMISDWQEEHSGGQSKDNVT